jgi:hypothetical protein
MDTFTLDIGGRLKNNIKTHLSKTVWMWTESNCFKIRPNCEPILVLKSHVLKQYQVSWKHDYIATGRMAGMKGTVSYQLPRLRAVEWTAEVGGGGEIQKYLGGTSLFWQQRWSPGTNRSSNLEMCGSVLWGSRMLRVAGEERGYKPQDNKKRLVERLCSLINVGWN